MKKIIVFFVIVALLIPGLAMSQSFEIMTEELPPFNFSQNGSVVGISADTLIKVLEKAGTPVSAADIKSIPWPRAYKAIQEKTGTILFSMARTEQREKMFKWVGPIYKAKIGLIGAKSKDFKVQTAEDFKKYKIGTIREGAPEQLLVKAGGNVSTFDRDTRPDLQIKKLNAGRIDLFSFNLPTAQYLMAQQGMNPAAYDTVYNLKTPELYIAFHKDTDDAFLAKAQKALDDMKASGEFDAIVQKYLGGE